MPDLAVLIVDVTFGVLLAWASWVALRRRDALARDVVLVFAPIALLLGSPLVAAVVGSRPAWFSLAVTIFLLAQPVFSLKLVADIRPLPRPVLPVATAAFGIAAAALLTVGGTGPSGAVTLGAIAVFVVTELVAAFYFGLEARHRAGSARMRLAIAALATGAVAASILASGVSAAGPAAAEAVAIVVRVVAVLAAVGYWLAFLPPARLRGLWQATAAYRHSERLSAAPSSTDASALWADLASAASSLCGSGVAVVRLDGDRAGVLAAAGQPSVPLDHVVPLTSSVDALASADVERGLRAHAGARASLSVRIGSADDQVLVVLLRAQPSLFDADDAALVRALATRSADLVARRHALAEQERLAARLTDTVTALEAASAAKSDFLASMSHELRTPLNAIVGFSALMGAERQDNDGNVCVPAEWIEHIDRGGQHLLGLVNDVLDLSKVEAGRLELERTRFVVATAVAESVAGLRPLAERKRLTVEVDIAPQLELSADRGRFRQILYNLLSNAIKYTPEGGRIMVSGRAVDDEVRVAIADTGIGIALDDQTRVFEEFQQVGDAARRQEGTGLGLALTRRLVQAHGGTIELVSQAGAGSTFTVVVPASPSEPAPVPAAVTSASRAPTPSGLSVPGYGVLIVEDDPSAARLLRAYLEPAGYAVRIVGDGPAALAEAMRERPGAILLDVLLPGSDGWEVLRELKANEALRDIPVVIVTVVDEREVGLALGAADYLLKPVDPAALLACLDRHRFIARVTTEPVRILAVDDDAAALDVIEAVLRPAGFDFARATGGREALELARATPPDLIICDLVMPDVDGFGVVAGLKAQPATKNVPILIVTGQDLTSADKERLNGDILGVVSKGVGASAGLRSWLEAVSLSGAP